MKPDPRDMNPNVGRTTADAARKRIAELEKHPEKLTEHYRDELTVTDEVPCADCPDEADTVPPEEE